MGDTHAGRRRRTTSDRAITGPHPSRAVVRRLAAAVAVVVAISGVAGACSSDGPGGAARSGSPPTVAPPALLAAELAGVETAIADPATPDAEMGALGQRQQAAYRELLAHPEWQSDVFALLPQAVRPVADAHLAAGRALGELHGSAGADDPLPHWRIVAPEPAPVLLDHYWRAEAAYGVPWEYLAAIHLVETRMGRIQGDSSAGAQGPMQFIPSTWEIYGQGGDVTSTADAIPAAARLLADRGAPHDMASALHAYNPSRHYVEAVSTYARRMEENERAYLAYHGWQVYYGDRLLPEGTVIP